MSSATSRSALAPMRTAPDTTPAPSAAPPAAGAAAGVWAALTASPGATAAAIADAAGITRTAAGRELGALRAAGRAVKTPGVPDGRRGTPAATWTPAGRSTAASPAAGGGTVAGPQADGTRPQDGGRASEDPAAAAATGAGGETAGPATPQDVAAGTGPAPGDAAPADVEPGPQDVGSDGGAEVPDDAAAEAAGSIDLGQAVAGTPADGDARRNGPVAAASAGGVDPDCGAGPCSAGRAGPGAAGETYAGTDGLPAGQAAGMLRELSEAAGRAMTALGAGEPSAALAEVAAIRAAAAESGGLIKAAAAGRTSPAARPGGLRDLVDAHLHAHPGTEFTAGQIAKVLGRSAGAIANALDRLTTLKRADLSSEAPRRYRAAPASAAPAAGR